MPQGYESHVDYMGWVKDDADSRQRAVEDALRRAFLRFVEKREVDVIAFSRMGPLDLAEAIVRYPVILKPLLAACNIAARAIERDLSIRNLDTYSPKLSSDEAKVIAGYVRPFLPPYLEIPALCQIDRVAFIDKEIRKGKGRWEKKVLDSLNRFGPLQFCKRMFMAEGEQFELDAASPRSGDVEIGIDVKRIEARRDIHKRCDEIVNKAAKLRVAFPQSRFGVVVYYPFSEEHVNIQNRLRSDYVGGVVFAGEARVSIENAVGMLLPTLGVARK
jgi:hypothetical protein